MWPLRLAIIMGALCTLAPVAHAKSPCSVTLPDGTVLPCVDPEAADAGVADKLLASLRQTGRQPNCCIDDSYNCFFYIQTTIDRRVPFRGLVPYEPLSGIMQTIHITPGSDYINAAFLENSGYQYVFGVTTLRGSGFQLGDIILVPGKDNTIPIPGEQFNHAAIVYGIRNGQITRIRQKLDPFNGVVDLTPQQFESVYKPTKVEGVPAEYQVYRHPPLKGKITVKTGYVRHPDGLYATAQQINVTIFLITPDGAYIGPQPIFPSGAFVA
jgi:hypothetical protein